MSREEIHEIISDWMTPSKEDKYISELAQIINTYHTNKLKEHQDLITDLMCENAGLKNKIDDHKGEIRSILKRLRSFAECHQEFLTEEMITKAIQENCKIDSISTKPISF